MGCDKVDACQLVTRSIAESDAAWGATGNRGRHRQERMLSAPIYAKKGHPFEMSFSIKVAITFPHARLQYHRPAVDKGD